MNVAEIIRAVSFDLNDQEPGYEYTQWSYQMLKHYLLEALIDLSQTFYKFFITRHVIQVETGGAWQRACCGCDSILRVLGETNADGTEIKSTLIRMTDNPDNDWPTSTSAICERNPDNYQMIGYSISNTDDKYFRVFPPPNDGKTHYVAIECYSHIHDIEDNTEVFWRFIPIVKEWMLGRAYMVDGENNPAIFQLGRQHIKMYDMLIKRLHGSVEMQEKEKDFERAKATTTADS